MRLNVRTSITRRLTLLFIIASSAVLLTLGFVIAAAVEQHFEQQDMEILTRQMALARHSLEKVEAPGELEHIASVLGDAMVGQHGAEVLVFGPQRELLLATENAKFSFELVAAHVTSQPHLPALWAVGSRTYRAIAAELAIGAPSDAGERPKAIVAVAIDVMLHHAFMRSFLQTLWTFVVGAAALTGLLGWMAARRGLAPLRAMREQAQVVTAQQLSHRLPVAAMPIELAELAQSLNAMLARLEEAFLRLSDFSSDIAHELRTPVNNLMTQTQVALSHLRGVDEYRGILESNAEEFEHMARMISDMLLLAKAGNGLVVPNRETVDLMCEVRELFEYFDAVAEEKRLHLVLQGAGEVNADRVMLRRALANLLANAVRHSAVNASVRVTVGSGPDSVSVCIENTGDTIPHQYLERIFDRFFRVDPSRQRNSEGTGLGLAITQSIVAAHGGTITAASDAGVTRFTISLPRRP